MVNKTYFFLFLKAILLWRNLTKDNYRQVEKHMPLLLKEYGAVKDHLVDRQSLCLQHRKCGQGGVMEKTLLKEFACDIKQQSSHDGKNITCLDLFHHFLLRRLD